MTRGVLSPSAFGGEAETRLSTGMTATPMVRGATHGATGLSGGPLDIGASFGRYHIIRLLGTGGMGSVYQAWDRELEVAVAVKVIRPDIVADPAIAQEVERRFKRELLLARQVTHKNVVRIHDIGEIDGIKYITMPYIQGSDLRTVLAREGRLLVTQALQVAHQVAAGLVAAHEAGVVHRDLKPANIMIDAEGHALIMDFGIARSTSGGTGFAATVAGAVIGTVEYMAPEQAQGGVVDQRADIYAFGLILRDMMLGGRQVGATTAVAELMSRIQRAPPSMRTLDANIPDAVDQLVTRCLQPDPQQRYQTSAELLRDLEAIGSSTFVGVAPTQHHEQARRRRQRRAIMAIATAAVMLGTAGGIVLLKVRPGTAGPAARPAEALSLAVLPFRNASGDPALDSLGTSLGEVLATDLGESSHVRTIPSARVHRVLGDLRIEANANLAPADLARIAEFASARSILWGQYVKFGDEIRLDATLQDLDRGKTTPLKATAANQGALLDAVAQLAASIQQALAEGSVDVLNELKASAWRPSTQSFEALRLYNDGLQMARDGKPQEALKRFEAAVQEDGNFALAYSAMAQTYATLGYDAQAEQYARRALGMSNTLQSQERLLITAAYYRITNDLAKGIETYEKLLAGSPDNAQVHFELGGLYERTGELIKAQQHYARAVALDSKHVEGLTAAGRVAIKRGDPQASLEPLNTALSLAVRFKNDEARATVLQAIGIAYKRMGQPTEALKQYQESLEIKRKIGQKRGAASSLSEIAQIQETLGKQEDAAKSYGEALAIQREIGDKSGMGTTLVSLAALETESLGRPDEALPLLREALSIAREGSDRGGEALALNNIGTVYLAKGQYSDAQTYFERALELREPMKVNREIADTTHNLGETLNKMGKYDQALTRYLRALDLRRADGDTRAAAMESYSIGAIFDYQGRFGAAVKSKEDALRAYRDLKRRDFWLGEILSGYGYSLALAGRVDEASASLEEAMGVARDIKNQELTAQVLRFQAERALFAGDSPEGARVAAQAVRAASRASDQSLVLWARAVELRITAGGQPSRTAATTLLDTGRQAEAGGLMYLSVYCALHAAETLLKTGDPLRARTLVEATVAKAETLGLRELQARGEYVLATILRAANDPQARRHYAAALRVVDEMTREDGGQKITARADLKQMYAECVAGGKGS